MQCPRCGSDVKRRRGGKCPSCDTPLRRWRDRWIVDDGEDAPNVQIVALFEELLSQKIHAPFQWKRGSRQYIRELVMAERFLHRCNDHLRLALETLRVQFQEKSFSWKERTSLGHCFNDIDIAMAIAARRIQSAEDRQRRFQENLQYVLQGEDVFAQG
jgi:hypothetical protein